MDLVTFSPPVASKRVPDRAVVAVFRAGQPVGLVVKDGHLYLFQPRGGTPTVRMTRDEVRSHIRANYGYTAGDARREAAFDAAEDALSHDADAPLAPSRLADVTPNAHVTSEPTYAAGTARTVRLGVAMLVGPKSAGPKPTKASLRLTKAQRAA